MGDPNPTPLAVILGGEELTVKTRDGESHRVWVYQLPVRRITRWAQLNYGGMDAEPELVELYADKPQGWADTLTLESYDAVLAKGEELNRPTFAAATSRYDRRAVDGAAVVEGRKNLETQLTAKASATPSPGSASV